MDHWWQVVSSNGQREFHDLGIFTRIHENLRYTEGYAEAPCRHPSTRIGAGQGTVSDLDNGFCISLTVDRLVSFVELAPELAASLASDDSHLVTTRDSERRAFEPADSKASAWREQIAWLRAGETTESRQNPVDDGEGL